MSRRNIVSASLIEFHAAIAAGGACVHCNKCMVSIYSGTRCVLDHPEPLVIT